MKIKDIAQISQQMLLEHDIDMDIIKVSEDYYRLEVELKTDLLKSTVKIQIHIMNSENGKRGSVILVSYFDDIEENQEIYQLLEYFNHNNDIFKAYVAEVKGHHVLAVSAPCYYVTEEQRATQLIVNWLMPDFLSRKMTESLVELDSKTTREDK